MRSGVTVAILAGGKSSRFGGRDKQELLFDGEMLGRRVARMALALGAPVIVAGSNPRPYTGMDLRLVGDARPGFGPLSGLHAALEAASTPWVYLMACDMPYMEETWLDRLLELAAAGEGQGVTAIAAERGGKIEPFHALYSRPLLPELDELFDGPRLDLRRYSITSFMREGQGLIVPEESAGLSCPGWAIFRGINDAEELAALSPGYRPPVPGETV
ncbi:MAG: molybdenum cofactor guanylyltransferase [Spirochaetes bacterium]|nr:molybdenum cofactor guanylyltransferase [Spirochaetota bacterium]